MSDGEEVEGESEKRREYKKDDYYLSVSPPSPAIPTRRSCCSALSLPDVQTRKRLRAGKVIGSWRKSFMNVDRTIRMVLRRSKNARRALRACGCLVQRDESASGSGRDYPAKLLDPSVNKMKSNS
jgi:hypothetical protein